MELPSAFRQRITGQLRSEADLFFSSLEGPAPVSIRINPFKPFPAHTRKEPVLWNPNGFYLDERPSFTLDPAFHAGMYYVQEAASMSLEFVLGQLSLEGAVALDLCASPGGKSSLLASHLWPRKGVVLANEVIRQRAFTLKENLVKWGLPNILVSQLDPRQIGMAGALFDLILIDAPCSGEGMFRKDDTAKSEWSPEHVELCSARQKRILSDVLPALKEGGHLIYSTCTFSEEENEENLRWLKQEHGLTSLSIPFPENRGIVEMEQDGVFGYRFYPHRTKGEGLFIALLQKTEAAKAPKTKSFQPGSKNAKKGPAHFVNEDFRFFQGHDGWHGFPSGLAEQAGFLQSSLPLFYPGLRVAEEIGKEWKPAPELAFSVSRNREAFSSIPLERKEALRFLHRDELKFPDAPMGWLLLDYLGQGLGFVKNLGNRSNSQYPKEWRILMSLPAELPPLWYDRNW